MNTVDEMVAHYIDIGALDVVVDEDGEMKLRITEKTEALAPELYEAHMTDLNDEVKEMYDMGLVDFNFNDDLEAVWFLTEKGWNLYNKTLGT